jgi:outer membrane protein OmpA-like peptidoglycan-associated protein
MMATLSALAQQGENLVRNGTFEQGNVGFKSDFRFLPHECFVMIEYCGICGCVNRSTPVNMGSYIITDSFSHQKNRRFYPIIMYYDSSGFLSSGFPSPLSTTQTAVNPVGPSTGSFLAVNINISGKQRIWYDSITIKPNTTYSFSCILANVCSARGGNRGGGHGATGTLPPPNPGTSFSINPGSLKLCVNGKKLSKVLDLPLTYEWKILSGMFTSGPGQTRIAISIEDIDSPVYSNLVALDNIVFKEIQPGEYEKEFAKKKEERFPKLRNKDGVVAYRKEPVIEIPPVKKEEAVVETPSVKEEEPIAVITPPVKKEEPVIETPSVKEEEPVVEVLPKTEPSVVIPAREKASVIVPPKPKRIVVVPPKPKIPIVVAPKLKPVVVVTPKPVKKDTASQMVAVSSDFKKDISIDEIKLDQKLQLSHIYFERAKFNLLETSFPELNDLVTFMKRYPNVRIRLEGHTDNQGNPERNLELSENRAKEVKKYLVDQGIDENRIECIGYGGQRPTYSNANENLRPKNRRVEVVIISK